MYVLDTAEEKLRKTCGSASSCSVPITEKTAVSTIAGRTSGIFTDQAIRPPAPSIRAAS